MKSFRKLTKSGKKIKQRWTWENQKYDLFLKFQILNHPDPSYSKHRIQISELELYRQEIIPETIKTKSFHLVQ